MDRADSLVIPASRVLVHLVSQDIQDLKVHPDLVVIHLLLQARRAFLDILVLVVLVHQALADIHLLLQDLLALAVILVSQE